MTTVDEPIPTPEAEQDDGLDPKSVPSELVANSVGEYLKASFARMRGGETGILPVVAGLLLVSILFQAMNEHFLTAGNLVNLLVQAAVFSLLAMGEVYALLLGEIDLSMVTSRDSAAWSSPSSPNRRSGGRGGLRSPPPWLCAP